MVQGYQQLHTLRKHMHHRQTLTQLVSGCITNPAPYPDHVHWCENSALVETNACCKVAARVSHDNHDN